MKRIQKMLMLVIFGLWVAAPWSTAQAQDASKKLVTVDFKSVSVKDFFAEMKKQTGLNFIYNADLAQSWPKVTVSAKRKPAEDVIDQVTSLIGCSYEIKGNIVTITRQQQSGRQRTIKGVVRDDTGAPLMGVPICIGETRVCTVTDEDGAYSFKIPVEKTTLKYSYVDMDNQYVTIPAGTADVTRDVAMKSGQELDEVVVTGIFTRKKESFTGSASTYTAKELKEMGSSNVLQSLKTLDPAFAIIEDTQFGSDPNRLPNMEIRGKSSMLGQRDELATDPNQPLFILDGFVHRHLRIEGCQWCGRRGDREAEGRTATGELYRKLQYEHPRPVELRYDECFRED